MQVCNLVIKFFKLRLRIDPFNRSRIPADKYNQSVTHTGVTFDKYNQSISVERTSKDYDIYYFLWQKAKNSRIYSSVKLRKFTDICLLGA